MNMEYVLYNADVISQEIGKWVKNYANQDVKPRDKFVAVHAYALQVLDKELLFCWKLLEAKSINLS